MEDIFSLKTLVVCCLEVSGGGCLSKPCGGDCGYVLFQFEECRWKLSQETNKTSQSQALVSLFLCTRCNGEHSHALVIGGSKATTPAGHCTNDFANAGVSAFMAQYDFEAIHAESFDLVDVAATEVLVTEHEQETAEELEPVESDG